MSGLIVQLDHEFMTIAWIDLQLSMTTPNSAMDYLVVRVS
jgi:hypothetical protein